MKIDNVEINAVNLAHTIMERTPKMYEPAGSREVWSYDYGVVLRGFEALYRLTGENVYYEYIRSHMDAFVREDGSIRGYEKELYNIDFINNGKLMFLLYHKTGEERYKKAMDLLRQQLRDHPRTSEGAFWHKKIYPWQIWLDGLYMEAPFYARYLREFEPDSGYQDVVRQFELSFRHLRNPETGLLHHGWDERRTQIWADPESGRSPHIWCRAMGWYVMALADTLAVVSDDLASRQILAGIYQQVMAALFHFRDPDTGLWYQVMEKGGCRGNYLESSGSAMILCALRKGIRLGILSGEMEAEAMKGHDSYIREFVLVTKEGWINLNKTCQVAGLGGESGRDGTYAYYISEPVTCNDLKGLGAFLQMLAAFEE